MKQHYKPMLAQSAQAPFNSKDWIFEIKWDGIRAVSYINAELSLKSRNDNELKHNFPELEELKDLAGNAVLDGEVVVMKEGRADFQALLERSKATSPRDIEYAAQRLPATYVVFDILEKDDQPLINFPLIERKKILKQRVKEGKHVVLSVFVEEEGKLYYDAALKMGVEGIMAKKKDSPYQPGFRSSNWLKIKKLLSWDCVIFGYTAGEGRRADTFGALILGMYDKDAPVYVGKVGTGFPQNESQLMMTTFQKLIVQEKTLEVADVPEKITWLKPELVCEVIYQAVTKDGKLRMPRFRTLRADKTPRECTLDQIKQSSLNEYASRRDFKVTTEPKGEETKGEGNSFVVQEHHARALPTTFDWRKTEFLKAGQSPRAYPNPAKRDSLYRLRITR
jgi:DNA ligase D-like protein (predicted ligase)